MALELRKVEGSGPKIAAYDVYNGSTCVANALRCALYNVCPMVMGDAIITVNSSVLTNEELTDRIMMIPVVQSSLSGLSGKITWSLKIGDSQKMMAKTNVFSGDITFQLNGKPLSLKHNKDIIITTIRDRQEIHITGKVIATTISNGMYSTVIRPRLHTHAKKTTRFHQVDYPLYRLEFEPKDYYSADENMRLAIDYLCECIASISESTEIVRAELQTIITIHKIPVFVAELICSDLVSRGYHCSCYRSNPDNPSTIRLMKKTPSDSGEDLFRATLEFLLSYLKGSQKKGTK